MDRVRTWCDFNRLIFTLIDSRNAFLVDYDFVRPHPISPVAGLPLYFDETTGHIFPYTTTPSLSLGVSLGVRLSTRSVWVPTNGCRWIPRGSCSLQTTDPAGS